MPEQLKALLSNITTQNAWYAAGGMGGLLGIFIVVYVLLWLIKKVRKPAIVKVPCGKPADCVMCNWMRGWLKAVMAAFNYLRTRREWRYQQPWVLMLGEHSAGKTSLLASVSAVWRQIPPARASELAVSGTSWHYFKRGVVIDPDGQLPVAAEESGDAKRWRDALVAINDLRPERPLDGIVMTLSARSLLHTTSNQRQILAKNIYHQLLQLQETIDFILPVYVVVTQCDDIEGYSAYWRAQPVERQAEIFGWSAPSQAASAAPAEWADAAFEILSERLRSLQIDVAASQNQVDQVDSFFLFPYHFKTLCDPLSAWLNVVFQPSAWNAGFLCRGIYFTGSIEANGVLEGKSRSDVAFVDQLFDQKVLAESRLARPTRHGVWSRNKLIRYLQISGIAAFSLLCIGLIVATIQFNHQIDAVVSALKLIEDTPAAIDGGDSCVPKDRVFELVTQIARINHHSLYWAIPASWVDNRVTQRSAKLIANTAFQRVILPGLACQLKQQTRQIESGGLVVASPSKDENTYQPFRRQMQSQASAIVELERNIQRFKDIAPISKEHRRASSANEETLMKEFIDLTRYAYGAPLPDSVARESGALAVALTEVHDRGYLDMPLRRQRFTTQLVLLAEELDKRFKQDVGSGASLLDALQKEQAPLMSNALQFSNWLNWTRTSWLGATSTSNPCEDIRGPLQPDLVSLVQDYGYDVKLERAASKFNTERCFLPSQRKLRDLTLAPYGLLFTEQAGVLDVNPAWKPELLGFPALVKLTFMQRGNLQSFVCQPASAGWRNAEVTEANSAVSEYQAFVKAQGLTVLGTSTAPRPLYDKLARSQLESVLNDDLQRAQMPPAASSPLQQVSLDAVSQADQQLAQMSSDLAKVVDPLTTALHSYGDLKFAASGAAVNQCALNFATDALGHIETLADVSRLYVPTPAKGNGLVYELGSVAVMKDYLARQVARAQVLAGYAGPFLKLIQGPTPVNDANIANSKTAIYWSNTVVQINNYVQGKDPTGQVGSLDNLFLKQLGDMTYANCNKVLAAYQSPALGNDLFSVRREALEAKVQTRCDDHKSADADELYHSITDRFNAQLQGRYPFADLGTRDAALSDVRAFFQYYDSQRSAMQTALTGLTDKRWTKPREFLTQLDATAAFFRSNLSAEDQSLPVKLSVTFRALPTASTGGEQLVGMALTAGSNAASFPNGVVTLDSPLDQMLALDLTWADRSVWQPVTDPQQSDLLVANLTATYAAMGPWSLFKLIDKHKPKTPRVDPLNPNRTMLEFVVPVQTRSVAGKPSTGSAHLFIGLDMSGVDPKTKVMVPIKLPVSFPRSAPSN